MKALKPIVLFLSLSLAFSCGDGNEKKEEEKESVKIGNTETKKQSDDSNVARIALTGNDLMQFNMSEIKVKAGQQVVVTLRHIGEQGLEVMGHNFVLLKPGTDLAQFAADSGAAGRDADWIPNNGEAVIAHTKMIGGGESTQVSFTAPEAGTYDFVCSFPGHYSLMKGKFIVE